MTIFTPSLTGTAGDEITALGFTSSGSGTSRLNIGTGGANIAIATGTATKHYVVDGANAPNNLQDHEIEFEVANAGTDNERIVLRWSDTNNYLFLRRAGASGARIYSRKGASESNLASFTLATATRYILRVVGNVFSVIRKSDSAVVASYTDVGSVFPTTDGYPALTSLASGSPVNPYLTYFSSRGVGEGTTDTTPDAFSFTDQTDVARSTVITSDAITVAGITSAAAVSIIGGEWQKNGGAWSSSPGTVVNNDTVRVRHTSSNSFSAATNTALNIGGVSDTFSSVTAASETKVFTLRITDALGETADLEASITVGPATSEGQDFAEGRDSNHDAGTDADFYADRLLGSDSNPGTFAQPFATPQVAANAAMALPGNVMRTVAVKGDGYLYRDKLIISGYDGASRGPLVIKSYGTDKPIFTGGKRATGLTACTSDDAAIFGPNWAQLYKAVYPNSFLEDHASLYAMVPLEAGEPLLLVQRRFDTSDLFTLSDYKAFYQQGGSGSTNTQADLSFGLVSTYLSTVTHPSVLGAYTDEQLAKTAVAVHHGSNRTAIVKTASASGGVLTVAANTYKPNTANGGYKYALLNILPAMQQGQWGYFDNGDGTFTFVVWPNNPANIATGIELASRDRCIHVQNSSFVTIEGLFAQQCTSDSAAPPAPIFFQTSTDCFARQCQAQYYSNFDPGNGRGGIHMLTCSRTEFVDCTAKKGQNSYGYFATGIGSTNRFRRLRAEDTTRSPWSAYQQFNFGVDRFRPIRCGKGAHANLFALYLGCDQVAVVGYLPDTALATRPQDGYGTIQQSSRALFLHSVFPMGSDGRAFVDQTNENAQPTLNSQNYILNCLTPHREDRADSGYSAINLGAPTWDGGNSGTPYPLNWTVLNTPTAGISFITNTYGGTITRANNVLTKGAAANGSETVASFGDIYQDQATGDFRTKPGSILTSKAGQSAAAVIATYEAWFPDIDFRKDALGRAWDPAAPGVGPYGAAWPVAA